MRFLVSSYRIRSEQFLPLKRSKILNSVNIVKVFRLKVVRIETLLRKAIELCVPTFLESNLEGY